MLELERVAELGNVRYPAGEIPLGRVVAVAAALPAVVDEHQLQLLGERFEDVRQRRMVESRPAVQQKHRRPLAHRGPVRD